MNIEKPLKSLPSNFKEEEKNLLASGITTWSKLMNLSDKELNLLDQKTLATTSNLRRLRGMAGLVCEINLSQAEAALLIHSGIATVKALANCTPQQLVTQTGRLDRQLKSMRKPLVDLQKAQEWIHIAKDRQMAN